MATTYVVIRDLDQARELFHSGLLLWRRGNEYAHPSVLFTSTGKGVPPGQREVDAGQWAVLVEEDDSPISEDDSAEDACVQEA